MPTPDPQIIRRLFDGIAGRYDLMNVLMSAGLQARWRTQALRLLDAGPADLLLDACAGTGDLGLASNAGRIVAVDFSRPMLARLADRNDGRLWPVCADALRLPLADGSVDRAVVGFSLRNLADVPAFFAELHRVVRPGGRLVSLELTRPPGPVLQALHRAWVRWLLPLAGFPGRVAAYRHLAETVLTFPEPAVVAGWLAAAGWGEVTVQPLSGGICTVHVGVR